jgi:uncharacterized protein (TIGR02145 family)
VETVVDVLVGNWDVGGTKGETFSINREASFGNANNGGRVKLNGSYTLSLTARIKLNNYKLDYAKMSIGQNKNLNLEAHLKGNISRIEDFELMNYRLPDIEFWAGVWVYLKNDAVIKAKVEVNAQANMDANLFFNEFSEYGFEYRNGFKKIDVCNKDFYYDYKHSVYGNVRLGVLVGFRSMLYGSAGLELSAGPSLELKSPRLPLLSTSRTSLDSDLDIDMSVRLELLDYFNESINFGSLRKSLGTVSSSKTLPSFNVNLSDFDLKNLASGKLSFPFRVDKPNLGFSVEESGFCMETKEGECIKGPGIGLGKFGKTVGSIVNFEGLTSGTYDIIPYFKSLDGEFHYDIENILRGFAIGTYCNDAVYDPNTQFCSLQELKVYALCGGKDYNTLTQFCSGGMVYNLCAGKDYNPDAQFCSSNTLYDLCGGDSYNPSAKFCFNKMAYIKCDGKNYNPDEEMCCGTKIYNLKMQGCYGGEVADREFINDEQGYRYGYVKIGEQTWLSENLNYAAPGSKCYGDDPVNCRIYGRLYDWAAAMALPDSCNTHSCADQINSPHQGICPNGWHIPNLAEWNKLILFANGTDSPDADYDNLFNSLANRKLLATSPLWRVYFSGGGTNDFGFSALPGGYGSGNSSSSIEGVCFFWSTTEGGPKNKAPAPYTENYDEFAVIRASYIGSGGLGYFWGKSDALSIRCVKD